MASPIRLAAAVVLLAAATAATAHAGPPFISVELPANPLDRTTRGAYLLVHSFHHEQAVAQRLVGTAEGMVGGRRQSVPITFEATSRPGVYAVRRTWGTEGSWLLVMRVGHEDWPATALVAIGRDGEVTSVRVPTELNDGHVIPARVPPAEVDRALRQLALDEARAPVQVGWLGGLAALPLLAAGWTAGRRRADR